MHKTGKSTAIVICQYGALKADSETDISGQGLRLVILLYDALRQISVHVSLLKSRISVGIINNTLFKSEGSLC